ncbi:aminoacyl-tRNA deacylase [Thermococcus sp.]|uniref:aminoacyl-tRNA deacylase n=1 Tax=Thermococcus sp. TaxID=35749 RepID=UPI0025EB6482|nr:YbaK/EbsC family protein [Thermococcus sp.]
MIKSLVIISEREPLLVIVDGESRVDMKKLEKPFGKCRFARPEKIKELTGYEVKGIPLRTIVDPRVLENDYVIGGGGAVDKLLKVRARKIVEYQNAEVREVRD